MDKTAISLTYIRPEMDQAELLPGCFLCNNTSNPGDIEQIEYEYWMVRY